MVKSSIYDFNEQEINYVKKLIRSKTPVNVIRKKTNLDYNQILFLIKMYNLTFNKRELAQYSINDSRLLVISDNHLGSKYEYRKYLDIVYNYAVVNNIMVVLHAGDAIQGIIEPNKCDLYKQVDYFVKDYPRIKSITTYLLCGNHAFRSFKFNDEAFNTMFSRKDIKYLGFGKAYLLFHDKFISLSHYISKYYIDIPYVNSFIDFAGHHHYLKVDKNQIYVPTLSRDFKKKGIKPGFLEVIKDGNNVIVENKEINGRVGDKGVIFKKRL